jgi:hypothetical protein
MDAADRVASRTGVDVTFSFTVSSIGGSADSVTLNYPADFFATSPSPSVSSSQGTWSSAAPGQTSVVLTKTSGNLGNGSAVTMTLTGLSMGSSPTAGGTMSVLTNEDAVSNTVSSGIIGGAVTSVSLNVNNGDRVAGKTGAAATFSFTTTAGGALAAGGKITLTYPSSFFSSTGTPGVQISGSGPPTGTVATPTSTQIVITIATQSIAASTAVTVTVTGLTMGAATAGSSTGITVATSVDQTASSGVGSGVIGGQVTSALFGIATSDRVAGKTGAAATFSFTTTAGGALAAGDKITLTYPSSFFSSTGTPGVQISGSGTPTGTVATPTSTQIVITIATQSIAASTAVTVTVTGLTMGAATAGSSTGITVATSVDQTASSGMGSGVIGGQVTSALFGIATSDRVAGKTGTAATFSFTTTAGGALAAGDKITLTYPSSFFSSTGTPGVQISGSGPPTGTVATPTSTQIVITIATQSIAASTAVTVTVTGLTMGAATAGSSTGITVATSVDQTASSGVGSGVIGGQVTSALFGIATSDRVAGKTGAAATFSFTTTAGGALAAGDKITLTYPSSFFSSTGTPGVQISGSGPPTGTVATPTSTQIVITIATQSIAASTAVTVTVTGLTMGAATAGSSTGIAVATSVDQTASSGVSSGVIGGQVTSALFGIATSDRVAGKTGAAATFSFTTTAGGALAAGDKITLTYPSSFFSSTGTPGVQISGSGPPTGTVATPTSTQIVITIATQSIAASTAVTVTVTGLTMGAATAGSSTGITVATSVDQTASSGVGSGVIGGQVTSALFGIATSDRVAGKTGAAATFSFTTTAGGALAAGDKITLTYPSSFFSSTGTPGVQISGSGPPTGTVATPTSTQIVITIATQSIAASTAVTVTVTGLTMGAATAGSSTGITVATSVDQTASSGVGSGVIGGQVTSALFGIATSDRVAGKTGAAATFSFTTTAGGALAAGGKITLTYPSSFFSSTGTPGVQISGSGPPTGTVATPTSTQIVITIATQSIAASTAVTVTVTGLTMGAATAGSSTGIAVATSVDQTASSGVGSGVIGGQVTSALFGIATSDRVAGKTGAAATFSFTTTAGGALAAGGKITLTYPSSFFSSTGTPGVQISGSGPPTGTVATPTSTQIVITIATQSIAASTAVTVTVTGLTMGAATAGSSTGITVATSVDQTASSGVGSGVIGGQVTSALFGIATSDRVAGKTGAAATFSFTTTAGGALAAGDKITLTYPSSFFSSTGTPGVQISGSGPPTGTVATPTSTQIVITIATQSIAASTAVTVTVTGLTMGAATAGSSTGITVATSVDQTASSGVSSGVIGGQVTSALFGIATSDRVAGKTGAAATFSFTTTAGGALAAGGKITLTYPSSFFSSTGTPGVQISGSGPPTGTVATPTSTQIVITIATQSIAASTAVTVTVTGLTMGAATAGSSTGITVATSVDQTASSGVGSGVIGGQVTSALFGIATSDRVAGKTGAAATFSFTTTAGGALAAGGKITLTYPSSFFSSTGTPGVQISGSGPPTGTVATPTSTQIVITIATQSIAASTAVTVTVTGLTMGAATAGSSTGITVATSVDQTASSGVSSGVIGGQVTSALFGIATSDRVAGKTGAAATFSFTTTAGGALAAGDKITLTYPSSFFSSTGTPGVQISGSGPPTGTVATPTSTQIVITIATQSIAASTAVTVTVTGLTMGAATAGSSTGITVATSVDQTASSGVGSGVIGGQVTSALFGIATSDRVAGKTGAAATFSFTTTAGGALAAGGKITLTYPSSFFSSTGTPGVQISGSGPPTGTVATPTSTQIVITIATQSIAASTAVTVTVTGLTMGAATAGSSTGITVATSVDQTASSGVGSGVIGGQVTSALFGIATSDRVAGKTGAAATFSFTTTAGGALAAGDKITLTYPSSFFSSTGTPGVQISGSGPPTGTVATPTSTQIVITIATQSIAASTAVTVTVTGLTMGAATAGGDVKSSTSADSTVSGAVLSGVIGGAVTNVTFNVAAVDRDAGKTGSAATFTFTPTSGGAGPATITLTYPSGFFVTATPGVSHSAPSATITAGAPGATSIVMTTAGTALAASTAVTVTLTGLTMGAANSGGDITVKTSADPTASSSVASGVIGSAVTNVTFNVAAVDRVAGKSGCVATFTFTPTSGGAGPATITLTYPSGFFVTATPGVSHSAPSATITAGAPGATSIVMTTAGTALAASTAVTVTLTGLTMGAATAGGDITVKTNIDVAASAAGVSSGVIGGAVTNVTFNVAAVDRVAGKSGCVATFTFTPTSGGAGPTSVTLKYPSGFFVNSTLSATLSPNHATLTPAAVGATSIFFTASAGILANTAYTVTLTGLTMGAAAPGGNITVQTSIDVTASAAGVSSGVIGGRVTAFSFSMESFYRTAGLAGAVATFSFTTTLGGELATGSTITLTYPSNFFTAVTSAGFIAPSGVTSLSATIPTSTRIVITTATQAIAASTAITVTLTGLTLMSIPSPGGFMSLSTSVDQIGSAQFHSGVIGGLVDAVTFMISSADRVAAKVGVVATFTFTPSAGGALSTNKSITLNFPSGFIDVSSIPTVILSQNSTSLSSAAPTLTNIILTNTGSAELPAGVKVTVTLTGLKMGNASYGSSTGIFIQTSADQTASARQPSGCICRSLFACDFATSISKSNAPSSGSTILTVHGLGSSGFSNSVSAGKSNCKSSSWISDTSVICKHLNSGIGFMITIGITVEQQSGSHSKMLSYDEAAIGYINESNKWPSSGCTSVTVAGFSFGSWGYSGKARVGRGAASSFDMTGGTACEASSWKSNSGVECKLSAGVGGGAPIVQGRGLPVVVTFGLQQGSRTQAWCYAAAVVSSVGGATNGPSSGCTSVTVAGFSFGSWGYSGKARVGRGAASSFDMTGGTACEASSWKSNSGVECKLSAGVGGGAPIVQGRGLPVVVTFGLQQGSRTQAWCYAAAVVSSVGGATNGPSSGCTSVTVAGFSFGSWGYSGKARVGRGAASSFDMTGGTACEASSWKSNSGVECKLSAGVGGGAPIVQGRGLPVVVTFGLQQGSRTQAWCYAAAVVSSVGGATNGPSSGCTSVTVAGFSFGSWGYSGKARVGRGAASSFDMTGGTACEASSWKSNSGVECKLSAGVGGGAPIVQGRGLPVVVTFGLQQGSRTQAWCYAAAVVSSVGGATNGPSSGCASVTVAGFSFGSWGYSGKARVGRGAASSFDMTGGTACEASSWKSNSGVECKLSAGVGGGAPIVQGRGLPVVVTFGLQQGSRTQAWCYAAAVVSSVGGATNGPSSGCTSVTVAGFSFGSWGYSGKARVGRGAASSFDMTGGTACEASSWKSNSGVECKLSAGVGGGAPIVQGRGLPVVLTFGLQQGSRTQAWCYAAAVVSSVGGATNGPSSGCTSVTVAGFSFGSWGYSGKARVGRGAASSFDMTGGTACEASSWKSNSGVECKLSAGVGGGAPIVQGRGLPVVVTFGLQQGSRTQAWCYAAAVVSSVGGATNGPSSGCTSVTVAGFSFGSWGYSGKARVGRGAASSFDMTGGTACEASSWKSNSGVECKLSAGVGGGAPIVQGRGLPVVVTFGLQQGSRTQAWCYAAAVVSSVGGATNGPSSGCTSVTVAGFSFGSWGYSGKARVGRGAASSFDMTGGTACEASSWKSNSGVECKLSAGVGGGAPIVQGRGLPVVVTFGLQQGSRTQAWCYAAAVVSSVGGATNGPSSGCTSVTVAGFSFGSWGYSGKARVGRGAASSFDMTGGTACEASSWKSNSGVECKLSAGVGGGAPIVQGRGLPVVVTFGLQQGSRTQAWCYAAAVVSSVGGATNGPSSGCTSVTVAGFSFGSWGYSGKARVGRGAASSFDMTGGTACEASSWKSNSGVECKLSAGVGGGAPIVQGRGLPVVVTFGLQQGSRTQAWCYAAAVVSSVGGATNGPSSGCTSVTVAGFSIGSWGYSGKARVGRGAASSFDMTGGTACEASSWKSNSGVECKLSAGVGGGAPIVQGRGLPVVVTFGLQQGSRTQAWCYAAAVVSSVGGATNGPSSGCTSVTVAGFSFGSWGYSGKARVGRGAASSFDMTGGTACEASSWKSNSGVECKLSAGVGGGAPIVQGRGLPVVVTFGLQQGSRTQAWCYAAAVVSSVGGATNGPSSGCTSVTVAGFSFGSWGYSGKARVGRGAASSFDMTGGTACEASSWKSNSGVECKLSAGVGGGAPIVQGRGLPVVVTFGLQQGSRTQAWCYAAAVVSSVGGATNGPSSGCTSVTVAGFSFGSWGYSGKARVGRGAASSFDMTGGTACEASSWKSNSGVECKLSAGVGGGAPIVQGRGLPVVVTFGLQQGSRTQAWCYAAAVVSSVGGATNGPSSGCTSVTVAGFSFGSWGYSGKARVGRGAASSFDMTGGTACEASSWKSNSGVECKLSAGVGGGAPIVQGRGLPVVVTFGLQQGSRTQAWCYAAAVVSSVGGATNGPSSGCTSVTVAGFSFGSWGYSGKARVGRGAASSFDMTGGTACEAWSWKSNSGVECKLSAGVGGGAPIVQGRGLPVVVTFGLQQGSRTQAWCYAAAVVSSVGGATNGPSSGCTSVTVAGFSFGSWGYSGKARVGRGAASSFDMTGGTACEASSWKSNSGVECKLSAGVGGGAPIVQGRGLPVVVTFGLQQGSRTQAWCYAAAVVSSVGGATNGPSSGCTSVTVAGFSFGSWGYSGKARVGRGAASSFDMTGGTACEASSWKSNSGVECKLSAGVGGGAPIVQGRGLPVVVTFGLQQGSRTQAWCYAAAVVSSVGGATNGPSSGCTSVTVAGFSFGSWGYSGKARVGRGAASSFDMTGGTACEASSWKSNSGVECKLSAGVGGGAPIVQGRGLPVVVTFGLQQGSRTQAWCYAAAVVSSVGGATNGPSSGCTSVTVAGFSFGSWGYSGKARVGRGAASSFDMTGGTACEASSWKSNSGVECKLSAGVGGGAPIVQGRGLPVVVTFGLQQGSRTQAWCYAAAVVSSVGGATNGPSSGCTSVTVAGFSFGSWGYSGKARVGRGAASSFDMTGGTACEASSWKSNSGVECKLSAGVGGGAPIVQGRGLPVVVTFGLQQGSRTQAWCYAAAVVSSVGGATNGPSSGCTSVTVAGFSFGSWGYSGKARVGRGAASSFDMTGGTACEASSWKSNSGVECKLSAGVGGGAPIVQGRGLPVVVTFGLQQGSRTQAWCYAAAVVSSVGGATNGPSSGCTSVTVAGFSFGSWGYSGKARVGRGAASSFDMTGGTACEASSWKSNSGVECKLSAGVGGGRADCAGTRAAGCCDVWAAARQPHAGVVLRSSGCELCGRRDQRAVVGMHVCHGCRLQLRELGLQRQGARGPRGCVVL